MKKVLAILMVLALAAGLTACGPTAEETAQTKELLERQKKVEEAKQKVDRLLDESDDKLEALNKDAEGILGMSLDDAKAAMDEGKTLDEKKKELKAKTPVEEKTSVEEKASVEKAVPEEASVKETVPEKEQTGGDMPFWSVRIGNFDAMSDGLAHGITPTGVTVQGVRYEGYQIAEVLRLAGVGESTGASVIHADGTIREISVGELFANDTLLVAKRNGAYLETPLLCLAGKVYEAKVVELRNR